MNKPLEACCLTRSGVQLCFGAESKAFETVAGIDADTSTVAEQSQAKKVKLIEFANQAL